MEPDKLTILHDHYRDTCAVMRAQRKARDRYFYFVIALLSVALFDLSAPEKFSETVADVLRAKLDVSTAPDLSYVRSILWFLLLGLTVRYCQAALNVERQYTYVHNLEAKLSTHFDGAFTREGAAYLADYPWFLSWAHCLYTFTFPLLLCAIAIIWTYRLIPGSIPWPLAVWFDVTVTVAILISIGLYLVAIHEWDRRRATPATRQQKG